MLPRRLILLLSLVCLWWTRGNGQNCGSLDTVLLAESGITNYQLTIDDVLIDDLSAPGQGVCGIDLHFSHQYIYDVIITLTSPAGQTVTLIGPNNNQFRPPNLFTRWFIDFTSCTDMADPDPGAPPTWDNNHPFNWVSGGLYTGTYYPNNGCLEDFDSGPINGEWTLSINSNRAGAGGGIVFFRLNFCDDRGIDCCFADAGELRTSDFERCESHPDLDLSPEPLYNRPRPPAEEYGYTYLIGRDGFYYGVDSLADLTAEPPGRYTVCGLSYALGELDNLPAPDGVLTIEDIRTNLATFTPYLCGDITADCYTIDILSPPDTTLLSEVICRGDIFMVGDSSYDASGQFFTTLTGRGLCDSIVRLDLEVVDQKQTRVTDTVCFGDGVTIGTAFFDQTGVFPVTLTAAAGCDSIVTLDLTVRDRINFDTVLAICEGDAFVVGAENLTISGVYNRQLTSPLTGCDSFITVDLAVLTPEVSFAPSPTINCYTPSVYLDASPSSTQFGRSGQWLNLNGELLGTGDSLLTDSAGTYVFELTESFRGISCSTRDTLEIMDITDSPAVDAGPMDSLNCVDTSLPLGGSGTVLGPEYTYTWTGPTGAIFEEPTNTPTTRVSTPGTYQLLVFNTITGCQESAVVTVAMDTLAPLASIEGVDILNCAVTTLSLSADTNQPRAGDLEYTWTGDCLGGAITGPSINVDCPGSLTLTVRNRVNQCVRTETVVIQQDVALPIATVPDPGLLNCYFPTRTLDATASGPATRLEYEWFNQIGASIGTETNLLVSTAQTYELILLDTVNFCRDTSFYTVLADLSPPAADAGPDTTAFTCDNPTLTLGGPATSTGNDIFYTWYRLNEEEDTLSRQRTLSLSPPGGLYIFSVFDVGNGCTGRDSVRIFERTDPPFVRVSEPVEFGCFSDSVMLDASRTFLGFDAQIEWSGPCLPDQVDTTVIAVNCPGLYTFTVFNLETGCVADSTVEVQLANNTVVAVLPDTARLDCTTGFTRIDRSQSTPSARTTWFRDGVEVGLVGTNPLVTVPGTYTMVISNFDVSCSDTASIVVVADCPLLSIIIPPDSITCARSQVLLDAGPSIPDDPTGIITEWIVENPACVSPGATDRQLLTACPGTYGFVIRNTVLGISDTAFVEVVRNLTPPIVDAGPNDTLTCDATSVTLDASGSEQNLDFVYVWLDSGTDTLAIGDSVTVDQPGIYFLEVRNARTGCVATDVVTVFRDIATPQLDFSDEFIPCRQDSFPLSVTTIPEEGRYAYSWAGPLVRFNQDSATVILGQAGTYTATVTNLDNGCPTAASVEVEQLPCPPCPVLMDTMLTCEVFPLPLTTDLCEPCQGCTYEWFREGVPIVGAQAPMLNVTEPGNYQVRVVNTFGLSGSATAQVGDLRVTPELAAGEDRFLTCDSTSVLLGRNIVDTIFGFQYQWLAPGGQAISGANQNFLRVAAPGAYTLLARNPLSSCEVLDTVNVVYDTITPRAIAGPDMELNCDNRFGVLNGAGSSAGSNFRFEWTGGPDPACLEGINTLTPIAVCGGDYILSVMNLSTGCRNQDTVTVVALDELPRIRPLPDTVINCLDDVVSLTAEIFDPTFQSQWCREDQFGDIIDGSCQTGATLDADVAGDYRYVVTNPTTGCFNEFQVSVGTDLRAPTADAGRSDTLFCTLDSIGLFGGGTTETGSEVNFAWRSLDGFPLSRDDRDTAYAFLPGAYELLVTDQLNGCTALDTTFLFRDIAAPIALAGVDSSLNCTRRQLRLNGDGQTLSGQRQFRWTTLNGRILSDSLNAQPLVAAAGDYILAVTDPMNNCTSADVVRIIEDTIVPRAALLPVDTFLVNCFSPTLTLDGRPSDSDSGNPLLFNWSTLGAGTDLTGRTEDTVTIDAGGSYRLLVTDAINGCQDTVRVGVTANFSAPNVRTTTPNLLTCDTLTTSLTATPVVVGSPYRIGWAPVDATFLIDGPTLTVSFPGVFRMEARDTTNGCVREEFVTVEADRVPPIVNLAEAIPLGCDRATTFISATEISEGPMFQLEWSSPNGDFLPTNSPMRIRAREAGQYILTVEDDRNGCTASDTATVERLAETITALEYEVEDAACIDDLDGSVTVFGVEGGIPPFRYRLNGGLLTDRLFYDQLPIGTHTLTTVDGSGCERTDTFEIRGGPEVLLSLGPDITVDLGDSVALDFTTNLLRWDTIIWRSLGPIPRQGVAPLVIRPSQEYFYELFIRDENGCEGYDNVKVSVLNEIDFYMPNIFSPNGDSRNDLFFPFGGQQIRRVAMFRVFDRWGAMVHEATDFSPNDPAFGWDGTMNGEPLNTNVFIWQVELELFDGKREFRYGDVVLRR